MLLQQISIVAQNETKATRCVTVTAPCPHSPSGEGMSQAGIFAVKSLSGERVGLMSLRCVCVAEGRLIVDAHM